MVFARWPDHLLGLPEWDTIGTVRTDRITEAAEYADAGIGSYWIVDPQPPVTLTAHVLVDGEYEVTARGTGRIDLLSPLELTVDLDRLLP